MTCCLDMMTYTLFHKPKFLILDKTLCGAHPQLKAGELGREDFAFLIRIATGVILLHRLSD